MNLYDTVMEHGAREALIRYKHCDHRIDSINELIAYESQKLGLHSPILDGDRVQSTPNHHRLEDEIIKQSDLIEELRNERDEYMDYKREVLSVISQMPNFIHRSVLIYTFVNGKTNNDIGEILEVTTRTAEKYRSEAIKGFGECVKSGELGMERDVNVK